MVEFCFLFCSFGLVFQDSFTAWHSRTHSVDQASLKFTELCLLLPLEYWD